ncbi:MULTISPECIES: AdeC/AdeK/OprM family multidrug efflux complex outer membrane factor [Ralstonia]|uniref:Outer membrane protein OprM n=1 Tax=Ralstonia wenshanensis TaxID=2842456 RepID=A0AAD2EKV8_9RALS|nr:AdeC/AdeK/OprM family multidrug efflux complex outer membrane factor [Ralstonia wenshanensis]MCT7306901.1 AdeC/AdeK/OprM family multidrug efflux complex outer membrane factor [Ralstonia wenshanensis]MDY7507208.1 AdeC/AdeK/OprM family multidrug efflux complex outer membrane factor [Ralstonia wenshanensis]CAJ0689393.1 Outer membrane protein OprM [Ralstonia wenshanensis]
MNALNSAPQALSPLSRAGSTRAQWPARLGVALSAVTLAVLAGCANLGNSHSTQTLTTPSQLASTQSLPSQGGQWPSQNWVDQFNDPQLRALVDEAIKDNPNLQVAFARVRASRAMADVVRGNLYPSVGLDADMTRQRLSEYDMFEGTPLAGRWFTESKIQLGVSYDLDFWGKNRSALEAALSDDKSMEAESQASRLMLSTTVARTYAKLAALYAQRDVAERAIVQRKDLTNLAGQRVRAGLDTQVETTQARANVAAAQTELEQVDEQIALARNQLAALLGKGPDRGLAITRPTLLAQTTPKLPNNLTIDLIGRRPDLVAARWRVEAASKDIDVAKAQFLPDISLTAFLGLASIAPENLLLGASRQLGIGPALKLPIFQGGKLRANLRGKYANYDAAVASYNQTLTEALHDTADQITTLHSIDSQIAIQRTALSEAERAYSLARTRYSAGLGTQLVVLNAETTVLQQRKLATDLQARRLDAQMALIKALGGGYTTEDLPGAKPEATASHG